MRIDNVYGARVCAIDMDATRSPASACRRSRGADRYPHRVELYRAQPGELADRDGSFVAFARTRAEREKTGDPRLSLEERYGSREAYVAKVKAEAEALVAERLLLAADAAAYVEAAKACDRF